MVKKQYKQINKSMDLGTYVDISQFSSTVDQDVVNTNLYVSNYIQSTQRNNADDDLNKIVNTVRVLNNLVPYRMPIYNFEISEINGENYYRPDGSLLLIREWDNDVIRDYYASQDGTTVLKILEHDKISGRLRAKIEPIRRLTSRLKVNITIFDEKLNNKYYLIQLAEEGIVNNISEFTDNGKSFQTLFRNLETMKPVRYLEGKDDKVDGFRMVDCLFNSSGDVVKLKKFSNKKEVSIDYEFNKKNITVKNKLNSVAY